MPASVIEDEGRVMVALDDVPKIAVVVEEFGTLPPVVPPALLAQLLAVFQVADPGLDRQ
jgi:hypothetical protein